MTEKSFMRAMEASQREQQREAKKRQRELERQTREMAKLSDLEQARLEVETYENAVEVLLTFHKEQSTLVDWLSIAASLPPVPPCRQSHNELKARQRLPIVNVPEEAQPFVDKAKHQDEREYQEALQAYAADHAEWEKMSNLARRVLSGHSDAYIAAINDLSPFTELASIGSALHFKVYNSQLVGITLSTNGRQAIPSEVKTLTGSGKVSVKAMPKPRFVEIYQDYICGCVLRVARELFALLPIETLLITATTEAVDTTTGQTIERPFLSVVISRTILNQLNFDRLDPSDSILSMTHRGDLKALRKTGEFEFISPLTIEDLNQQDAADTVSFNTLLALSQRLRADIARQCAALNSEPVESLFVNGETP